MFLPESTGTEIFIGLVGAVGTDLKSVFNLLDEELKIAKYTAIPIRLSQLLRDCYVFRELKKYDDGFEDDRINKYMDAGDKFRKKMKHGDAVAKLAVSKVSSIRKSGKSKKEFGLGRIAYVFHSLKHPEEVKLFRRIYGNSFYLISAYSPKQDRLESLAERIKVSRNKSDRSKFRSKAQKIIERDTEETGNPFGQNVRNTFPLADVFIKVTTKTDTKKYLNRFVNLLFGNPFITPTQNEYGIFHAKAASLRSADLSRQVGAIIVAEEGEFISSGCNEVPKAGGGAVWELDSGEVKNDYRDFAIGYDSSSKMRRDMLGELFSKLSEGGWFKDSFSEKRPEELVELSLKPEKGALHGTRLSSILEYGRMVHAEMFAITEAAKRGLSINNAKMYCTTYPCHMCARHIMSSGINKVIYIEPYPKSLAKELYDKSIRYEDESADEDALIFEPFVGVAPNRFIDFFEIKKRKDSYGNKINFDISKSNPVTKQVYPSHIEIEKAYVKFLSVNSHFLGITNPRKRNPKSTGRSA